MYFLLFADTRDSIFSSIGDEERARQKTPLCHTPTSQLLQLAAQFLPTPPATPDEELNSAKNDDANAASNTEPKGQTSEVIFSLMKQGWWRASPSQLQEVSESIKNAGLVEKMAEIEVDSVSKEEGCTVISEDHGARDGNRKNEGDKGPSHHDKNSYSKIKRKGEDYKVAINSLSATISYLKEQNKGQDYAETSNNMIEGNRNNQSEKIVEDKVPVARCPRPLQPGSYWYSKQFQTKSSRSQELPSNSSDEVRKVLAKLANPSNKMESPDSVTESNEPKSVALSETTATPPASIDTSESFSTETITPEISIENPSNGTNDTSDLTESMEMVDRKISDVQKHSVLEMEIKETEEYVKNSISQAMTMDSKQSKKKYFEHNVENCVAADCMCYEAIFRQDHPVETSSVKSDSSFTESIESSPKKKVSSRQQKLSSSSFSDESNNSSITKKRSRIAAKFEQPLE